MSLRGFTHEQRAERRKEMAELVKSGEAIPDVARAYRVTIPTVRMACRESGVSKGVLRARRRKELAEAVASGKLSGDVAIEYGVDNSTVCRACRDNGIQVKRGRRLMNVYVPMERWRSVDWTMRDVDIAKMLDVTGERVRQVRKRLGLPQSEFRKMGSESIAARKWLETHRPSASLMTLTEIVERLPVRVNRESVKEQCELLGIEYAKPRDLSKFITRETLANFVDVVPPKQCWEWKLGTFVNGYGKTGLPSERYAHRFVYELFNGSLGDKFCLHECDNPKCVNPEHLYAGTALDNARDRVERSEISPVFTADEIADIRRRWSVGEPIEALAAEYGRCWETVYRVCRGLSYKHNGQPKPKDSRVRLEQAREFMRLYENGLKQREIGERYGVDQSTVSVALKRLRQGWSNGKTEAATAN